jgi:DNA-binding transcriptional ArsR family regulator
MTESRESAASEAAVPTEVDAASSKLVYLCLEEAEGATLSELTETLDMTQLTLYSVLGSLREAGLVEKRGETYHVVD